MSRLAGRKGGLVVLHWGMGAREDDRIRILVEIAYEGPQILERSIQLDDGRLAQLIDIEVEEEGIRESA